MKGSILFVGCLFVFVSIMSISGCTKEEIKMEVLNITLDKTELALYEGGIAKLAATVSSENAEKKELVWLSSDATVAAVDDKGTVTAKAAGATTIYVTTKDIGKTAVCTVVVSKNTVAVVDVNLNEDNYLFNVKQLLYEGLPEPISIVGNKMKLTAAITPENATNTNVIWTSDNTAVATVNRRGEVTAIAAGNATITVTTEDGEKTASCTITVAITKTLLLEDVKEDLKDLTDKLEKLNDDILTGALAGPEDALER